MDTVPRQLRHQLLEALELRGEHRLQFLLNGAQIGGENAVGRRASGVRVGAVAHTGDMDHEELVEVVAEDGEEFQAFEQRLGELQSAYAREDYEALRRITTPEMTGYLSQELGENASKGVRNEVYDVKLLSGDIAEAWREGSEQYATVSLKYESRDIVRDRATGQVVSGDDRVTEVTELWTFVRRGNGPWLVSAIQDV